MDVSARTTMKDAAKCDKRCEWQNSANQKKAERILRFQDSPESMPGSERSHISASEYLALFALGIPMRLRVSVMASRNGTQ